MITVALDTETRLIEQGRLDPDLVVCSVSAEFEPELWHHQEPSTEAHLCALFLDEDVAVVGANFSFDAAVIMRRYPSLVLPMFRAYRAGRVLDVQLAQKLIDLAHGEMDGYTHPTQGYIRHSYSLAALHERYGFGTLEKDEWRLKYGNLITTPLESWPEGAKKYALDDADATLRVWHAQQAHAEFLTDLAAQTRAALALHLQSCVGMITDARAVAAYIEELGTEIERCRQLLVVEQIVRPNGSKDTKKAKAFMLKACEEAGIEPKLTAKEGISLDAEACRDVADPVMLAYSTFTSAKTTLSRAETLKLGSQGLPLQTSYNVLVNNGRTSSREPSAPLVGMNLQNLPRGGKLRECFVARPGFVFCSVDYTGAELHTFAQVENWVTGRSLMGEALNAKKDLHCLLAATMLGCSYEECFENKSRSPYKEARQLAKAGNFGYLGGMGAKKFMLQSNKVAKKKSDRIDLATAQRVKRSWEQTWQPQEYFAWINSLFGDCPGGLTTVKQFVSERVRGRVDYTAAANTFFSGLAADGGKAACFDLAEACYADESSVLYGARPLLYIHDEIVAELHEDKAHEQAFAMRDLQVAAFNRFTPDFPVRAEPAVMKRLYKAAEAVYSEDGKILCWEPKQ